MGGSAGNSAGATGSSGAAGTSTAGLGGGAGTIGGGGGATPPDPNAAGLMPLRHLSQAEYLNTVADLLGDTSLTADALPEDIAADPDTMPYPQPDIVGTLAATQYHDAAQKLAANVLTKLTTFLPCNATGDATCAQQWLTSFLPKAYRRPVTAAETGELLDLYKTSRVAPLSLSINDAFSLVLRAILQSPGFLYHWEMDPTAPAQAGPIIQLDSYAIANRLSYFVTGSMPDAQLFAAAASGGLSTPDAVAAQVQRLLASPRAHPTVESFFDNWLGLDLAQSQPKDPTVYPAYQSDNVKAAVEAEAHGFVDNIVLAGSGAFADLFTSTQSLTNQYLAPLYAAGGGGGTTPSGATMRPVTLNPAQRSGILTSIAFLAATGGADKTVPPRRGKAMYTHVLCQTLGMLPNVIPMPVQTMGTTRQIFEAHDQLGCAAGCHTLIEPFGYTFEHYDGIGQFRTVEHIDPQNPATTAPIDSHSTVTVDGKPQDVADAVALSHVIAQSTQAEQCFATHWMRYALGRLETPEDQASLQSAMSAFSAHNFNVRDLIVGLVTSRTFRFRTLAPGEVMQ